MKTIETSIAKNYLKDVLIMELQSEATVEQAVERAIEKFSLFIDQAVSGI